MAELSQQNPEENVLSSLTPEFRKEFESRYRQEKLLENKLLFDKECYMCKFVTGGLFTLIGSINGVRVASLWKFFPLKEKIFNVLAISFIYGLSYLSFNAGYQIYMGKSMQMIEYRPSLSQRLIGTYNMIGSQSRQEYLEKQISYEEEKMALQKQFQDQQNISKL
ncbi:UNKNOWN [Stylonychia lemnae]|uniref:Transmembrane protein n=1 Tax=Stylonychia lemnae TaxID=5949 RepID=A0A078BBD2_STYLE|nr:UNKNOWN [Stylonychia lemnae]|eukprot:CDW91506.1 UNKNOWN [Stylonychia lemnae]